MNFLRRGVFVWLALAGALPAHAAGVQPESTIVHLSESDGQAQLGILNTDEVPLLLNVQVIELPEDPALSVFATPAISRLEPSGHQMVRFLLEKPEVPLKVQHLKRVSFEGFPGQARSAPKAESGKLSLTIRHVIPLVISPAGLVQDPEPWKHLLARHQPPGEIELENPSAFVVRLSGEMQLPPSAQVVGMLGRSFILPGEKIRMQLPPDLPARRPALLRITPSSPWGYTQPAYDLTIAEPDR